MKSMHYLVYKNDFSPRARGGGFQRPPEGDQARQAQRACAAHRSPARRQLKPPEPSAGIKFLSKNCPNYWLRQTPDKSGIWGNCKFVFDGRDRDFDYVVVYEGFLKDKIDLVGDPEKTILITGEPPSVKNYNQKFLDQFGTVITTQEKIKHRNKILSHLSLSWLVGYQEGKDSFEQSYDDLTKNPSPEKTKLISVICSNKAFTKGHRERIKFVEILKKHFGRRLDVYGRGFCELKDKWDAIAPYKYHIALENSFYPHYWSEKLADTYLSNTYPIYYGCPNVHDYFPTNSLTTIYIKKPKEAIKKIEEAIKNKSYERSQKAIASAKDLVLNKYNFFPRMAKFCKEKSVVKKKFTLYSHEYCYKMDPSNKKLVRRFIFAFKRLANFMRQGK